MTDITREEFDEQYVTWNVSTGPPYPTCDPDDVWPILVGLQQERDALASLARRLAELLPPDDFDQPPFELSPEDQATLARVLSPGT